MLCQGCGTPQPPDPPTDEFPDGRLRGICPECDGPLQRVPVGMAMAAQQNKMNEQMEKMREMQQNMQPQLPHGDQAVSKKAQHPGVQQERVDLGGGGQPAQPGQTTVRQTNG